MAMNVKQVTDALAEAFASARIVFWNDAGEDFLSLFDGEMFSPVEGVSVIRLDQTPAPRLSCESNARSPRQSSSSIRRRPSPKTRSTTGCSTFGSTPGSSTPTTPSQSFRISGSPR
jgi:hypothetical protein